MTISVTKDFYAIRVHIDGMLHLRIKAADLLGIHSWIDDKDNFSIEYAMKGGNVVTEYTDFEKWKAILNGLEGLL